MAELPTAEEYDNAEGAVVIGTFGGEGLVDRNLTGMEFLRPLLQLAFRILAAGAEFEALNLRAEELLDGMAGRLETSVEIDCADECFKGIFKHGPARVGVVLAVGIANFQVFSELPLIGGAGEVLTIDDGCARPIEGSLVRFGEFGVECLGDDEIEHGVAEKLQPLVVPPGAIAARMGESPPSQSRIFEAVACDGVAERFVVLCHSVEIRVFLGLRLAQASGPSQLSSSLFQPGCKCRIHISPYLEIYFAERKNARP